MKGGKADGVGGPFSFLNAKNGSIPWKKTENLEILKRTEFLFKLRLLVDKSSDLQIVFAPKMLLETRAATKFAAISALPFITQDDSEAFWIAIHLWNVPRIDLELTELTELNGFR